MSKTIVKSVLGVLFIEGKVVLTKRRDCPVWVLPGGKIDEGETAEQAIVREVKEETGYDVEVERKVALYTSNSIFLRPVFLFKLIPLNHHRRQFDKKETKELGLFSPDTLPYETVPFYISWIKETFENKPYFEKHITSITPLFILKALVSHPIIVMRFFLARMGLHINS